MLFHKVRTSAQIMHSIHVLSRLLLTSGSLCLGSEGGIAPWTSPQFITGLHRNKRPFTFAPMDHLESTIMPYVHVSGWWVEAGALCENPVRHMRNSTQKGPCWEVTVLTTTPACQTICAEKRVKSNLPFYKSAFSSSLRLFWNDKKISIY